MSSIIKANSIQSTGARVLASDSGSAWSWGSGVPTGSIIQTKFVHFDGEQTIGNGSNGMTFVNIGLGVSGEEFAIDMSVSSGNKIIGFGVVQGSGSGRYGAIKIYQDSTQIAMGASASNRTQVTVSNQFNDSATNDSIVLKNMSFQFHHTPSDTSSHTYSVKGGNTYANDRYFYVNKAKDDGDNQSYIHRGYSHFMLMEVAQ